ncbi:MAG: hypothetical protein KBD62_35125 [Kofleriaceae bacterium]|nr:hypothetical protein [Kofleriaceae bacterium]
MAERPVPPGWTSRERLYPVGGVPGGDGAILRSFVAGFADRVDGLDSAGPNAATYEELLFAYDDPAWRKRAADELYSCARLGCVLLDCAGADVPLLRLPYQPRMGQAVADVVAAGRALGAWVDTTVAGAELPTGPFVGLVGNNAGEGQEHVIVGLDGLDDDGECRVVEGGQLSTHGKGFRIAKGFYEFERRDDVSVWARRISPSPNPWRRLRGYIDLEACLFTQRATVPEDT